VPWHLAATSCSVFGGQLQSFLFNFHPICLTCQPQFASDGSADISVQESGYSQVLFPYVFTVLAFGVILIAWFVWRVHVQMTGLEQELQMSWL